MTGNALPIFARIIICVHHDDNNEAANVTVKADVGVKVLTTKVNH